MSRQLTASDRTSLIRLASTLPSGSNERQVILAALAQKAFTALLTPSPEGDSVLVRGVETYPQDVPAQLMESARRSGFRPEPMPSEVQRALTKTLRSYFRWGSSSYFEIEVTYDPTSETWSF